MRKLFLPAVLTIGICAPAYATPIHMYKCETDGNNDTGLSTLNLIGEDKEDGTAGFNLKGKPQILGTYSPTNNNKTIVATFETFTLMVNNDDTATFIRTKDGATVPMWCYLIHTLDTKDLDSAKPVN